MGNDFVDMIYWYTEIATDSMSRIISILVWYHWELVSCLQSLTRFACDSGHIVKIELLKTH